MGCKHDAYWIGNYGTCMVCRAEAAEARAEKMQAVAKSANWAAERQTIAYHQAMNHAMKCDALCRLAVRVNEASFSDPGDAVRWTVAINDYQALTPPQGGA